MDISKYAAGRAKTAATATYRFEAQDPETDEPIDALWFDFRSPDSEEVKAATKINQKRSARFDLEWGDGRLLKPAQLDEYLAARTALIDKNFADRMRSAFVSAAPELACEGSPVDAKVFHSMMLDDSYEWLQNLIANWYSTRRNFRKPTQLISMTSVRSEKSATKAPESLHLQDSVAPNLS